MRKTSAAWYLKNKGLIRERERARQVATPRVRKYTPEQREKRRQDAAKRYKTLDASKKERRSHTSKIWRTKHAERHKKNFASWAVRNKPKRNQDHRAWMAAHPEVRRYFHAKRRAAVNDAEVGESKLIAEWEKKWRTAKRVRCFWCLEFFPGKKMQLDHIIPLARDGKHAMSNVCTSCQSCNNRKKDKPVEEWNKKITEPVLF